MKQRRIILIVALMFLSSLVCTAQDRFSESKCVARWTDEVDRPFRLRRTTAIKQCRAIAARINALSKQILGKWQPSGSKGQRDTLEFLSNGTVRGSYAGAWVIVNPYGTLGSEVIQFNDDYLREIKIAGATLTIISTPTRYSHVERWKRTK